MKQRGIAVLAVFFLAAAAQAQQWTSVGPGVEYRRFTGNSRDVHVTRVDLTNDAIRVIGTRESDRGTRVSEFARRNKAIAAINADYFSEYMQPVGLSVGPCGHWKETKDTTREGVVAVGAGKARIDTQSEVMPQVEEWIDSAVSGWPMLVRGCTPLTASDLPGSDAFTRSPHPRSAAGVSRDGKTLYLVVAEGRRADAAGMTLAQLASFMSSELGACAAINFDGGGSSAMWLGDKIVSRPSDGSERRVVNHLAVVLRENFIACDTSAETRAAERRLAIPAEIAAKAAAAKAAAKPAGRASTTTAPATGAATPGTATTTSTAATTTSGSAATTKPGTQAPPPATSTSEPAAAAPPRS